LLAPNIDPAIYPTAVALKSVHNTVIESLWNWLRKTLGFNLKDIILQGKERHLFNPNRSYHP
jgi:hypothetical protein